MSSLLHKAPGLLAPLLLAACVVGPDYRPPQPEAPEHFHADIADMQRDALSEQHFWQGFGDPVLAALIDRTLDANRELHTALARLDRAAALLGGARLEQLPSITAGASASEQHLADIERLPGSGQSRAERYQVAAALSWELDLFGRLRRITETRRAELDAADADVDALRVALVGQLATSYFELRGLQQQAQTARQNIANQQASLEIVSARLDAGRGTAFDQVRARAQLESTRAALPELEAEIGTRMHRIAVLSGQQPTALTAELASAGELPATLPIIPTGSPGDALRRRPDIRVAERQLAAATARIGVATADLFPRFSLDALLGSVAGSSSDLFNAGAESRRVTLGVDWSFIDTGRVRARINAADADARAALAQYEQTVLGALEETETLLLRYQHGRSRSAHLQHAAAAAAEAAALAHVRYDGGFIGYFEVLAAEQELIDTRDALNRSRTQVAVAMANVYRALAGAPLPAGEIARQSD